jgi:glycerol uptake facilitator-like aquaporin
VSRRLAAEWLGTALLVLVIVGSGITASADGAASAQLFQHAVVVGAALAAIIAALGPVSGAHLNPVVTAVDAAFGGLDRRAAAGYVLAQMSGAVAGVAVANALFGLPAVAAGTTARGGAPLAASEAVATAGLLLVVFGVVRGPTPRAVPAVVGAWVAAAIYATSSTAFANPAVTVARALTDSYTGIAPADVPAFLAAQVLGAGGAAALVRWLFAPAPATAAAVHVPHDDADPRGARP